MKQDDSPPIRIQKLRDYRQRYRRWLNGEHEFTVVIVSGRSRDYVNIAVVETPFGHKPRFTRTTDLQRCVRLFNHRKIGTTKNCSAAIAYVAALEIWHQLMLGKPRNLPVPNSLEDMLEIWKMKVLPHRRAQRRKSL